MSAGRGGQLWAAIVAAANALGIGQMLPRLVAEQLPEEAFLRPTKVNIGDATAQVTAVHTCPHECTLEPQQCLTALVAEAHLRRTTGRPWITLTQEAMPGGYVLLHLEALMPDGIHPIHPHGVDAPGEA